MGNLKNALFKAKVHKNNLCIPPAQKEALGFSQSEGQRWMQGDEGDNEGALSDYQEKKAIGT